MYSFSCIMFSVPLTTVNKFYTTSARCLKFPYNLHKQELTDTLRKLKEKLVDLNEQKTQLDEEKRELIKGKTKLELDIKDSEDAVTEFHTSKVCELNDRFDYHAMLSYIHTQKRTTCQQVVLATSL